MLLLVSACKKDDPPELPIEPYSFFVAGHVYGNHLDTNLHLYPVFKEQFSYIQNYPNITMGFLTGDIVRNCNSESWDAIDEDLIQLGLPVYFAPGNHDVTDRPLYEMRYGDPLNQFRSYRSFMFRDDLFVILDSELDAWNISGDQLGFLDEVFGWYNGNVRNVFVFVHALIWWNDENIFQNIHTNWWPPHIPDSTNYWTALEPLFQSAKQPVILIAGDLGANEQATPYMYFEDGNVTYIGSGMGNKTDDNFIFVSLDTDGEIEFELIALQGDRHRLGDLEDFVLP